MRSLKNIGFVDLSLPEKTIVTDYRDKRDIDRTEPLEGPESFFKAFDIATARNTQAVNESIARSGEDYVEQIAGEEYDRLLDPNEPVYGDEVAIRAYDIKDDESSRLLAEDVPKDLYIKYVKEFGTPQASVGREARNLKGDSEILQHFTNAALEEGDIDTAIEGMWRLGLLDDAEVIQEALKKIPRDKKDQRREFLEKIKEAAANRVEYNPLELQEA
ncbi:MAG: hypothetical protein COT81_03070 [Candidatus Buchananbacteria bacterium CG10_big_fil_rev_8_21_14_0_10_42_9]|uniref:Uncharacterized protein n=1 Tax=Candidatus Buchananbacteria bacterium CG10_big_fil_rev_8_21_14_0_10_42_9 TaxID=1974526 RepID=A0A2H0W126_9BACT|nr:MAG: hypothetical protein COT81_03070 [Candidatus Buchananbacteria bacterium CG10_big_fil_rev_8_21_14_0_10_42_9]